MFQPSIFAKTLYRCICQYEEQELKDNLNIYFHEMEFITDNNVGNKCKFGSLLI